jgi:NAD(P)-dependent dehydrogenase (short-subunit alcohol dehydrogenase family)
MVETTVQHYGKLDILHNNVGGGGGNGGHVVDLTEDAWDRCLAVNLKSRMLCCKCSVPRMLEAGGGSIINVSSMVGAIGLRDPKTGLVAYSTAKAGVSGFTRALAADYAADGIVEERSVASVRQFSENRFP